MIVFVHGPDRLFAREAALAHTRAIDPDESSTTWIDAREAATDQIISMIGAASFFGAPRVVVVSSLLTRPSRDGKFSRADAELKALLAAVPADNCLMLFEPDMDAPPAAIKSATPAVTILGGEPPRGIALLAWIEETADRAGTQIDRRTAQLLAETIFPQTWDRKPSNPRYDRPPDMALLRGEVEKLALASYPDAITRNHILALIPSGQDQRVFRFLDASTAGKIDAAHRELEQLLIAGEEPAMLLAQLLGQAELMAIASQSARRDHNTIARDLGTVTPSRMSAVANSAQRHRLPAAASLDVAAAIDRSLKTGRIRRPGDALYQLMLAMAAPEPAPGAGRSW